MTQTQQILNYMRDNGGITSWEAIQLCGCTRLAARISEIEARHPIGRAWEVRKYKNGQTKKFIRYYLEEEKSEISKES